MGGGGGLYRSRPAGDYQKVIQDVRNKTQSGAFETKVNELMKDKLTVHNDRDSPTHQNHLEDIKKVLESEKEGIIDLKLGGSISKHTYIDGFSDIDVLVLVDKSELSESSPDEIKKYIKKQLEKKVKNIASIEVGDLAVTVVFKDGSEIQLLPALRHGEGYKIAERKTNQWSNVIHPEKFARKLTEINQTNGKNVVRVIKLVKGINAQLPPDQQLSGYHIESLAIKIFRTYPEDNSKTPKAMLEYFFEKAKDEVKTPIKDRSGQSINVDEDLGPENSPRRLRASNTVNRIYTRMKNANSSLSTDEWTKILGNTDE